MPTSYLTFLIYILGIKIYRTPMFLNECDDGTDKWGFDGIYPEPEKIVKVFSWAQWDCVNQVSQLLTTSQNSQFLHQHLKPK